MATWHPYTVHKAFNHKATFFTTDQPVNQDPTLTSKVPNVPRSTIQGQPPHRAPKFLFQAVRAAIISRAASSSSAPQCPSFPRIPRAIPVLPPVFPSPKFIPLSRALPAKARGPLSGSFSPRPARPTQTHQPRLLI